MMVEHSWWCDLYTEIEAATDKRQIVEKMCRATDKLGFSYWAYGARAPKAPHFSYWAYGARAPKALNSGQVEVLNAYPPGWMPHYLAEGLREMDSSISAATRRSSTITWSEAQEGGHELWSDAEDFRLRVGMAHPSWDRTGSFGLLTLARDTTPLSPAEYNAVAPHLTWMSTVIHAKLGSLRTIKSNGFATLSAREIEILRWTALGKTASEVAAITGITTRTVNFHVGNILVKLNAQNKIQAAVRATSLGLL
jgi:LuxR family quorum-sensing system transcriptional regulator SolR